MNARVMRILLIFAATAFGFYLCYRLALPFMSSLTAALVLSIMLLPMHRKLERRARHANLAASISVGVAAIVIVVPLAFMAQLLLREAASGALYLSDLLQTTEWRQAIEAYPRIASVVTWLEEQFDLAGVFGGFAAWLSSVSASLLRGSIGQVLNLVLTFYLLFYFLRDRRSAIGTLRQLSPLDEAETEMVFRRFADTVHATIFGTVVIAALQGTLGGLMFWWLGLPTPVFWGATMGLLAIVPVLGAFVVWVPAAIFLALEGDWGKALLLSAWGGVIIATIDNLLFPVLVGSRLKLHTVVALIGTIGGIVLFGATGLILGPATIALTLMLVEILKRRFHNDVARAEVAPSDAAVRRHKDEPSG